MFRLGGMGQQDIDPYLAATQVYIVRPSTLLDCKQLVSVPVPASMSSQKPKRLTVTARNLTVKVNSVGEDYGETIASVVDIRRVAALFGGSKNVQQRVS